MEKKLTYRELLENLITSARDPFCDSNKFYDIRNILMTSSNFKGLNHLYLAETYLQDDNTFNIDKEEALNQINMAMRESNKNAYFMAYRYYRKTEDDPNARNFMRISLDLGLANAYFEMGNLLKDGILFEQDREKAAEYYERAGEAGVKDSYFQLLILAIEDGDNDKAQAVVKEAEEHGVTLPGVVR